VSVAAQPSVRRALTLLVASGAAIVGLVLLVVCYTGVGVTTLTSSNESMDPCVEAYAAGTGDASVRYTVVPPQAICTWDVAGEPTEVVVAAASTALFAVGATLAVGGVLVCVGLLVTPWVRRRRSNATAS
jgi:NADH:ubiquinone oxidoreductase subunit K